MSFLVHEGMPQTRESLASSVAVIVKKLCRATATEFKSVQERLSCLEAADKREHELLIISRMARLNDISKSSMWIDEKRQLRPEMAVPGLANFRADREATQRIIKYKYPKDEKAAEKYAAVVAELYRVDYIAIQNHIDTAPVEVMLAMDIRSDIIWNECWRDVSENETKEIIHRCDTIVYYWELSLPVPESGGHPLPLEVNVMEEFYQELSLMYALSLPLKHPYRASFNIA